MSNCLCVPDITDMIISNRGYRTWVLHTIRFIIITELLNTTPLKLGQNLILSSPFQKLHWVPVGYLMQWHIVEGSVTGCHGTGKEHGRNAEEIMTASALLQL
uniref:Uncharacterized protein n=1 Tax=Nelumbo nucifera TaxID=4432 RepID=A0A822ZQ53_NELNU|nr:TPA_asm: hypothetical protein HUJ06_016910 [Nelumbo nucifera]